jgi:hypothetical protein
MSKEIITTLLIILSFIQLYFIIIIIKIVPKKLKLWWKRLECDNCKYMYKKFLGAGWGYVVNAKVCDNKKQYINDIFGCHKWN